MTALPQPAKTGHYLGGLLPKVLKRWLHGGGGLCGLLHLLLKPSLGFYLLLNDAGLFLRLLLGLLDDPVAVMSRPGGTVSCGRGGSVL